MRQFTVSTWQEGTLFVAQCLELDIASQGESREKALSNLREALELFFDAAGEEEIQRRVHHGMIISSVEVPIG